MSNPTVNNCPTCGGTGNVIPQDPAQESSDPCPQCSGAGRVVGVPKGSIVVADDTRVAVFERMAESGSRGLWPQGMITVNATPKSTVRKACRECPAAIINLVLDSATQEEAPDGNE